ncbi:MAG: hypothetical protein B7Z70_12135 [Acidithiobacillus ferrivorans]|uniref:Transposase n=1 Tax=Acidithiobacillus ferrivorans TaxID=160808 RepID=A0A257SPV8_9PROT|nr:MAG: hypothetical protein B7Z70_12135 [Acidithiobacillus ferrivorans]
MASETQRKYQRRSAEGWRALLAQQAVSGLTIGAFCRKVSVSTASFYRWRELLQKNGDSGMAAAVTDRVPTAMAPHPTPDFVDLGALEDLASGHLFVFINRRATQMKVLYWDRTGFCLWAKRLEQGRFLSDWQKVTPREMDWTGLKLMLEGIEPGHLRKRYKMAKNAQ